MSTLKTQMITTAIRIITGSAISNQLALASPVHPVPSKLACSCPLKVPRKLCNTHQFLVWSNYRSSLHWSSFIHPEGKAYFSRNSGVTVVTKAKYVTAVFALAPVSIALEDVACATVLIFNTWGRLEGNIYRRCPFL